MNDERRGGNNLPCFLVTVSRKIAGYWMGAIRVKSSFQSSKFKGIG